ncbi:nuclear transport factor 2 family protein [Amycolatopsis kentuckyensis]|uniref:nuclear transport factor 2 family protein n=1 Tax=Amycolatopsis kentuckyensis TaxID=218823 RepID=UPI00356B3321
MTTADNASLGRAFFDLLDRGDLEGALDLLAEDGVWTVQSGPAFSLAGDYTKQQFPEMLAKVGAAMPDGVRVEIATVTADEYRVVVEAVVHGTNVVGKTYDNKLVYVLDVRDGKIVHGREYLDTIHARDVLVVG